MAAPKKRIYELSKDLGKTNQEIMTFLEKELGITVKSHASSVEQDVADKVMAAFSGGTSKPAAPTAFKSEPAQAEKPPQKSAPTASKVAPKVEKQQPEKPASPKAVKPSPQQEAPPKKEPPSKSPVRGTERPTSGGGVGSRLPDRRESSHPQRPGGQEAAAQISKKASPVAIQEAPSHQKPDIEEDDSALELLKPDTEEEPYTEIAKTVERQQKLEPGKTTLRKIPEVEKGEKPIPLVQKKDIRPGQPIVAQAKAEPEAEVLEKVKIEAPMSIAELAQKLNKRETELIRHLFMKGVMVTVNQTMQVEDAVALAKELGFDAEGPDKKAAVDQYTAPEVKVRHTKGKNLRPRAPVVSIMGHVDHGKTSLLDAIRKTRHNIVDTEAGGITQSIGAYTVEKDDNKIVFIDTPGHEAFTSMRMRGAQATDIAILVVAADDGVMPQTIEAINHAKAANIPIIVAINKIDKPGADPEKVLVQLSEHGLTSEKWGGDAITVEVSALQNLGLDDLLEMISLVAELQDLKADPTIPAEGVVIEARLDKGKGAVATVLVQNGTLHVGENIVLNRVGGRVRALINDYGERVKSAGPSTPVEILGLNEVPHAGDPFIVVLNDKEFKRLLQERQNQDREQRLSKAVAAPGLVSDKETNRKDFYLIIKADTQGSVEAISASILQLATEEVSVHVLHGGTGDVSDADVLLASASNALIIAFNVKTEANALKTAQDRGIEIRDYDVIYHVIEDMEKMMLGMLAPETEEQELGAAEVRQLFSFGKTTIAGCYVIEGKVVRNGLSRVYREGKEIFKGTLNNLKRFKDDAKEVASGYECGVSFDKFNDLQPGDLIRVYTIKETERTSL